MNILFVGADYNNSRDGVIVKGIYNLINFFNIKIEKNYHVLEDDKIDNHSNITENIYDGIVICGTPWLWDQFQKSIKYKNLLDIISKQKKAKIMFLGVGACIGLQHIKGNLCEDAEHQQGIRELFGKGTVVSRDSLFDKKLKKSKVESHLLPCPSFFCYLDDNNCIHSTTNVLIWCDPSKSISKCDWQIKDEINEYNSIFKKYYELYNPKVYCAEEYDILKAKEAGLPEPIVLKNWSETLDVMKKANFVLSGRIHCAVPAFVLKKHVSIVPIDSRHLVLSDYGCPLSINNNLRFGQISLDINKVLDDYGKILIDFFSDCSQP